MKATLTMSNDQRMPQLLEPPAPPAAAVVGSAPTSTAAGNAAALNATKESLEDYTLRFAPRSYRKWSAGVVATSALGGIAYLADFSIGANIGIAFGTVNAIFGILVAAVIIFATGFPLAYYAARYNIDLDLITRPGPPVHGRLPGDDAGVAGHGGGGGAGGHFAD